MAHKRILLLILLASFLLSFSYSLYFKIQPKVDALAYDKIALNIVDGNGYKESVDASFDTDFSIARIGPLYEYFLAAIYSIFGHNYFVVWFLQAIIHAVTAFLVYLIGHRVFAESDNKEKIALWAAGIFGFYPDLIEISAMLMTETLYLFLFALMLYIFFDILQKQNTGYWIILALGLISGVAVLARPPILFCLPVVLFYFYKEKLFKQGLFVVLIFMLTFVPWTIRNYVVYDEIIPFGVAGQLNFWIGNRLGGNGEQEISQEIVDFTITHPIKDLAGESVRQFRNFVFNYPREFEELTFLRINKYFSIIRPMGFWFYTSEWRQMLFVASSALASIFLFILGLAGAIEMFRERSKLYLYMIAFTVMTPLILFITVVETRYRFQIYPLLALFAGYFIMLLNTEGGRKRKIFLIVTAVVLLNGGVDLLMNVDRVLERFGNWF